MTTNLAALQAYARKGHRSVQGWLTEAAIDIITALSARQAELGIEGGIAEIGIHHGRSFILLHLLSQEHERSVAYDLFEMQDENVDRSGAGNKECFIANLRRHRCDTRRIVISSRNSLRLTAEEVRTDAGAIRLFSVDGGHTPEITANDLAIAEASLCRGGLLVLDDFFNERWPGVAEGATRYLLLQSSRLVPVGIGGGKFVFTNDASLAVQYRHAVRALAGRYLVADQQAFGADVVVAQRKTTAMIAINRLASMPAWRMIKDTNAGRALKGIALRRFF